MFQIGQALNREMWLRAGLLSPGLLFFNRLLHAQPRLFPRLCP